MTDKKCSSKSYDPSPEEIAEAAANIRASWDEHTEQKRRCIQNGEAAVPIVRVMHALKQNPSSEFACYYGTGAQ